MKMLLMLFTVLVFLTACSSDESAASKQPEKEYQVKAIEKVRNIEGMLQTEANKRKQQMDE